MFSSWLEAFLDVMPNFISSTMMESSSAFFMRTLLKWYAVFGWIILLSQRQIRSITYFMGRDEITTKWHPGCKTFFVLFCLFFILFSPFSSFSSSFCLFLLVKKNEATSWGRGRAKQLLFWRKDCPFLHINIFRANKPFSSKYHSFLKTIL